MNVDIDALRQRLMYAVEEGISPVEVFKEMGYNINDPAVLQEILAQAGLDLDNILLGNQGDITGLLSELVSNISPEDRQQLTRIVNGIMEGSSGETSLPEDFHEVLKNLQKP